MLKAGESNQAAENLARLRMDQFGKGARESCELAVLPRLLEGCDRFIDVGANIGQYTYYASLVLDGAEILAIEANPELVSAISAAFSEAREKTDRGNSLTIETCAILDEEKSIEFFISPSPDTSSVFSSRSGNKSICVPARPLDTFYKFSRKTVIKIDIEGAEYRAIRSASKFLRSEHTEFFLELHWWGDSGIKKYPLNVCNLFFINGYACRRVYYHYHFFKANLLVRGFYYLIAFPHFLLMWLPERHPRLFRARIKSLHVLLAKVRRRVVR